MNTLRWIRAWLVLFIICLAASGLTAFPLEWELRITSDVLHGLSIDGWMPGPVGFIDQFRDSLIDTYA